MNVDTDYLTSLQEKLPLSGVHWGCSFDGQRLALVGYTMIKTGEYSPINNTNNLEAVTAPIIFYAGMFSGMSISRSVRLFDTIAEACGLLGLGLIFKGQLGRNEVFIRHLRTLGGRHGVRLFHEGQGRHFDEVEVLSAVNDDKVEGVIRLAPEFERRPERTLLDEEIGLIDLDGKMSPLQEAFIYGLGEWCCKKQRPKFHIGALPFRMW